MCHGHSRKDLLETHKPEHHGIGQTAVRLEVPIEGKGKLILQNWHEQLPASSIVYIVYVDFGVFTKRLRVQS